MLVSAWGETKDKQNLQALDQERGKKGEVGRESEGERGGEREGGRERWGEGGNWLNCIDQLMVWKKNSILARVSVN